MTEFEYNIRTAALFDSDISYISPLLKSDFPWQILPEIKKHILTLTEKGIEGFEEVIPGVLVGQNASIAQTAVIEPPAVIGEGCEIRPGAYIRGNALIGPECVIGNSTELKNCVLLCHVQVPHYNYVGDSILGNRAHLGAGAICSNLKADGQNIVINCRGFRYETGLRKVGAFIGDGAEIGCNCVLNPGTVIGKGTTVYPLTPLRGVYPARCIVKTQSVITIKN